jgi:hypothetical protein
MSQLSAAARLLARLLRERDELLAAAALDERDPLPPAPGPADVGALCPSRAADLWTGWQSRDGTLAERERLRQEALTDLASTPVYPALAPILAAALDAHAALAAALVDGRGTDAEQERHNRTLDNLRSHLAAVRAALTPRPAPTPTPPPAASLKPVETKILEGLADGKARATKAIAKLTGHKPGSLGRYLSELVRRGLLVHMPDGYRLP